MNTTYRASHYSGWSIDANPREQFVYNMAGVAGSGGSSYIDSMILRDRNANTAWASAADSTLEERVYYCQNWRADVMSLFTDAGQMINQVRYDPYGVPFGISKADLNADGAVNTSDITRFGSIWAGGSGTHPLADWNFDGSVNTSDYIAFLNSYNADTALGRGNLSYIHTHLGGDNRKAYAGYELDPVLADADAATGKNWQGFYHVRNRVYLSQLGRWTRRDPLGYVDGNNVYRYLEYRTIQSIDPSGLAAYGDPSNGDSSCGIDWGLVIVGSSGCGGGGGSSGIPPAGPPPPPCVPAKVWYSLAVQRYKGAVKRACGKWPDIVCAKCPVLAPHTTLCGFANTNKCSSKPTITICTNTGGSCKLADVLIHEFTHLINCCTYGTNKCKNAVCGDHSRMCDELEAYSNEPGNSCRGNTACLCRQACTSVVLSCPGSYLALPSDPPGLSGLTMCTGICKANQACCSKGDWTCSDGCGK